MHESLTVASEAPNQTSKALAVRSHATNWLVGRRTGFLKASNQECHRRSCHRER